MTDTVRAPREPTEAMLRAASEIGPDTPAGCFDYSDARAVWSAMLAASPQEAAPTKREAALADRLDALWLEMNDALAEPPATARILNALHDAAKALRTPPTMSADHIGEATNMIAPVEAISSKPVDDTGEANSSVKPTVEAVAYAWASEWTGKGRQAHALHTTEQEAAYNAEWMNGRVVPLYTEKPAAIELSKNLGELKPDALPGDMRERVDGLLARYFPATLIDERGNACGVSFVVREQRAELTNAILALIQTERAA